MLSIRKTFPPLQYLLELNFTKIDFLRADKSGIFSKKIKLSFEFFLKSGNCCERWLILHTSPQSKVYHHISQRSQQLPLFSKIWHL
jgi:hypothetical protein